MQSRVRDAWSIVGREALRIVLPSWCAACEIELPWNDRKASCCAACWAALEKFACIRCGSCAQPLSVVGDRLSATLPPGEVSQTTGNRPPIACMQCTINPLPLDWCDAWGDYRGVLERLLQALKFRRQDFLADALSGLVEETLRERDDLAFDAIVGVPMPRARERRRGYNQAELLARALARRVGIRCDMTLLARRGERAAQSSLPKRQRAGNVRGAFAASALVKGTSILLVDDISTTGETLRACANALREAGAARVCAVAVAKAS